MTGSTRLIRVAAILLVRAFYQVRGVNPARLPTTGGVLLLPNHVTWADSFFISAACGRPVRFVMDEAFMQRPAVRWFVTVFATVAIRRDQPREAIRIVIAALRAGDVVCLFPEGQLTRTGTLSKLQRGFELIAAKAGHPLVPLWCDGGWGSIFSFERGRFFGKWPYQLSRRPIIAAFGEPLAPAAADLALLRRALLKASAEAITHRFQAPAWDTKIPRDGQDGWRRLGPDDRRRRWVNGYQIGQIPGLQRRQRFSVLASELAAGQQARTTGGAGMLPAAPLQAFSALFKSPLVARAETPLAGGTWVGGDRLRALLETASLTEPLTFYDFSARALEPLRVAGLRHFPCLASDGMVVAMSMPDPAQVPDLKDVQRGGKPGTWGKLLPGWFTLPDAGGGHRLHGPAAPAGGLPLPANCRVDDDGFVGPP